MGRLDQSLASTSEFHDIATLGRHHLHGNQADNFADLEGTMHDLSCCEVLIKLQVY